MSCGGRRTWQLLGRAPLILPLASCYFSGPCQRCSRCFWNVLFRIARFGIVPCHSSCPYSIVIALLLAFFVCMSWHLGCWGLLGCCHIVWAILLYQAYKTLGPYPLSCLSFFHTSINMAGAVVFLALSLPLPPSPSDCRQPPSRLALFSAILCCWYCAWCAKFLGSKLLLVCAIWPGN